MRTVLLVEHEDAYRHDALTALERAGFQVIACTTTTEALAVLDDAATPVDVLLSRVRMPTGHPHGLALGRMVRYNRQHQNIRIVLYSVGYDSLPEEDLKTPPGRLLPRPEDAAQLVGVIEEELALDP